MVQQVPTSRVISIPFTKIAREEIGKEIVTNMVMLGAVAHFCDRISLESIEKAVLARVPKGTGEMNKKALAAGLKAAADFDLSKLPRSITSNENEDVL